MNTSAINNRNDSGEFPEGHQIGNSATLSKVGFYGTTPIVQRTSASQGVVTGVTDASGGTAAATNGILTITGTYNATILSNAIATLAQLGNANKVLVNQLRADLVAIGLIKGS